MNLIHVNQYCTYPRERKEPLYLKLREAKMTKTSTDKKISVIYMRLPKRLASSNDFLNILVLVTRCVPVFIKVQAISTRHRYKENQPTEQYLELMPCRPLFSTN